MTHTRSDIPTTSQPLPPRQRSWPITLLSQRSVQGTLLAWLMANALLVMWKSAHETELEVGAS